MSKQGRMESDSDPNQITIIRKHQAPIKTLKSAAEINAAQRRGAEIETNKKFFAGGNKQHKGDKNTKTLDDETEELHHDRVSLTLGKVLQQARQAKEWTQKDLATKVNEKVEVIREYENGKAVPNQTILSKMERCLGVKLRGKDIGQALPTPAPKSTSAATAAKK